MKILSTFVSCKTNLHMILLKCHWKITSANRERLAQRKNVRFIKMFYEGPEFDSADRISFVCNFFTLMHDSGVSTVFSG